MSQPRLAIQYNTCTVLRQKLVMSGTLDMDTGISHHERVEWQIEPCNAPLFADTERSSGVCPSCTEGYTHIHNFRVGEPVQGPCPKDCPCRKARTP